MRSVDEGVVEEVELLEVLLPVEDVVAPPLLHAASNRDSSSIMPTSIPDSEFRYPRFLKNKDIIQISTLLTK